MDNTDIFSERHDPNALKVKFAYLCWVALMFCLSDFFNEFIHRSLIILKILSIFTFYL